MPAHVVVVGAGIVGASTAFHLARTPPPARPRTVTLIEGGPSVAPAASGKAGGFLAADWSEGTPLGPLAAAGYAEHEALAALFGADTIGYRKLDAVSAGPFRDGPATPPPSSPSHWFAGGGRVRRLGGGGTTAQVHPARLTTALADGAVAAGATLRLGTPVASVDVVEDGAGGARVAGVTLEGGEAVAADAVVVAAGPWTGRLPARRGGAPAAPVSGERAHSVVLEAAVGATALFASVPRPGRPAAAPEFYPRPDGTLYACGEGDAAPLPASAADVAPDPAAIAHLRAAAAAVAPHALTGAPVVAEQACYLPLTPDGLPAIGAVPGVAGLYVGAGHGCWGILCGPVTGRALAELVAGGEAACVSLRAFDPGRRGL